MQGCRFPGATGTCALLWFLLAGCGGSPAATSAEAEDVVVTQDAGVTALDQADATAEEASTQPPVADAVPDASEEIADEPIGPIEDATTGTDDPAEAGPSEETVALPDDCPDQQFYVVNTGSNPTDWPAPAVSVSCDGAEVTITSNGVVGHEFEDLHGGGLTPQAHTWHFPQSPLIAEAPHPMLMVEPIGVAIDGVPIWGAHEVDLLSSFGDPVLNGVVDLCRGHADGDGVYHYHGLVTDCLLHDVPWPTIVGFAFDGFPIYDAHECVDEACTEVVELSSGWQLTGEPTGPSWFSYEYVASEDPLVLDECNGHVGPGGDYHYHATTGFPYTIGCFVGTPTRNVPEEDPADDAECSSHADCEGQCPGALGCVCVDVMMGTIACVGLCKGDGHCTTPPGWPMELTCGEDGICGLGGGGFGGGGGGGGGGPPADPECETDEDCAETCAEDAVGCVCVAGFLSPAACMATCDSDEQCPAPEGDEDALVCDDEGHCAAPMPAP